MRLAHLGLGPVVDCGDGAEHGVGAVLGIEAVKVLLRASGRRHLREDVPLALLGSAHVGEYDVQILPVRAIGGEEAKRRYAQPLLPGIGGVGDVAPWHRAADVGPVGEVDRERDDRTADEYRPDRLHVGQVVAANLGQVEEPDVAGREPRLRHALQELAHREAHHPHVHGDVAALGDEVAVGIGQRGGEVAGLAQERRPCRAHDHQGHLLRRRAEGVADDLQGHGVDGGVHVTDSVDPRVRSPGALDEGSVIRQVRRCVDVGGTQSPHAASTETAVAEVRGRPEFRSRADSGVPGPGQGRGVRVGGANGNVPFVRHRTFARREMTPGHVSTQVAMWR